MPARVRRRLGFKENRDALSLDFQVLLCCSWFDPESFAKKTVPHKLAASLAAFGRGTFFWDATGGLGLLTPTREGFDSHFWKLRGRVIRKRPGMLLSFWTCFATPPFSFHLFSGLLNGSRELGGGPF